VLPGLDGVRQSVAISHRECEIRMPQQAERVDTGNGFTHDHAHAAIPVGGKGKSSVGERQVGGTGGLDEGVRASDGHVGDVVQCRLDVPRAEPGEQPTASHADLTIRRSDTERQTRQPVWRREAELECPIIHRGGLPGCTPIKNHDADRSTKGQRARRPAKGQPLEIPTRVAANVTVCA
jgi:hypothetical protein